MTAFGTETQSVRQLLLAAATALVLMISALPPATAQTLDERLDQAFGPDERRTVLRQACLDTVGKITGYPPRVIRHRLRRLPNEETARARNLCRGMDDLYRERREAAAQGPEANRARQELASACSALIRSSLESGQLSSITPLQTMRAICQEMTGERVETPF
jgi:hypothetical protein